MIIGISGKIGSGKDTVGKILQYLNYFKFEDLNERQTCEYFLKNDHIEGFGNSKWLNNQSYQIKKFEDKLKEIVCLLIGCTREQLEDKKFKEKELGEEWKQYFNDNYDLVSKEESTFSSLFTLRKLMQLLGTECGRDIIHPNIWINALFADYKSNFTPCKQWRKDRESINCLCGGVNAMGENKGITYCESKGSLPKWIITDVKFPNEAKAIKDRANSLLIRVERPNFVSENNHESETALDNYEGFDKVIINDGNIEDLIEKVRAIWEKYS